MKWLSNRYAYPLVIFAMIASIGLQTAWLIQLFHAQQVQVKRDLDQAVADAARMSEYLSVAPGHENNDNFRNFFLSPEWLQLKQAYASMLNMGVSSRFETKLKNDSTLINIRLLIANKRSGPKKRKVISVFDDGETLGSVMAADKKDMRRMDSLVEVECRKQNINEDRFFILYDYNTGRPESEKDFKRAKNADYQSRQLGYNLNFFIHTYQLVVPSITYTVVYRMRYYLISSLLMILLTGLVFRFLFKVMRSQRLYTQARLAFTGNMTHELKTPVAVIEAALDSITRYKLAEDPVRMENYLAISKNEINRLNLMIDKVLSLEQLDNGKINLRTELYDVQQGLESVVSSMRLRNSNGSVHIEYIPSEEPCFVNGDPVHLTNVFYNLMDNAIKYSGPEVRIQVLCTSVDDQIVVTIQDNGPGITKIYHERIFERFFRIPEHADIHTVKGTGLGLHYVQEIIAMHGGSIKVLDRPEGGAAFIIYLPAYHEI
ncbi:MULTISPECIES: sensor histidine kinase [Chryseobacterium]|uniref:histidine kinase n=1 Tax=Chryseobacterium camelliae TaxID=1265445 RepID=A0ABU0TF30_9FLAO|nr:MULTISPECIES: ATP-binding protein [Chryseobacterium]MDT3406535.1 signal transduction histidine kinase [Pseudacidovorax intermedius]MDQ1095666.1 signal transduction histidine kinase [Chryseobacterium camelliae]MDQ1099603.1 signal transduction histidine kinase [Chryseobacterium sp. SORGH_AS_1048]MDR6086951.1 signal transduction histidine kinase [Chryseobacterium sp. SORGH_AS_0909]MDR6131323.1 signal transduction histidine kinase [Chryseobacterium sp. SORGH_AS_1175]